MADISTISLKSLLVPSKTVDVDFPGFPGFVLSLSFLTRETLVNIRKKSTRTSFKNRQASEELNDDLFLQMYVDAAIKGWKGFKFSYVEQLAPIDMGSQKPDAELEYSSENALALMKASANFDAFISETVTELSNFSKTSTPK